MIWISVFHLKNNKERNTQCEVEEDVGVAQLTRPGGR